MELLERASVLDELDDVLAALLAAGSSRERLFAALLDELDQGTRPQVVVVEDALGRRGHPGPAQVLAPPLGPAATLMVVTYRDDEVGLQHRVQLLAGDLASSALVRRPRLAPLSRRGVAVLAGPHGVDPDAVYEATGGNPFFVTEALTAGHEAIPATAVDAVLARAARLSPPARQVLDAAAVVAPPVETWLLAEAADALADSDQEPQLRAAPTRPTSRPGRPRWWRWSPRGCATPTSPGACSSPPRRSTTTSPPS
jgi:hypothetical protein